MNASVQEIDTAQSTSYLASDAALVILFENSSGMSYGWNSTT
jgi:hypothetical protein